MPKSRPPYSPEFRRQMVDLERNPTDPIGKLFPDAVVI